MAVNEQDEEQQALGPSVVLGLVGAVVVLLLLGAGIWGVGKIISKIRESGEEEEETVAEEISEDSEEDQEGEEEGDDSEEGEGETEEGDIDGDAVVDEDGEESESDSDTEEEGEQEDQEEVPEEDGSEEEEKEEKEEEEEEEKEESTEESEEEGLVANIKWMANNYAEGDITGDSYTVIWGDTLWEIAEARYGSGFEWGEIRDANLDKVGYLPNGSRALIIPGQVLKLP